MGVIRRALMVVLSVVGRPYTTLCGVGAAASFQLPSSHHSCGDKQTQDAQLKRGPFCSPYTPSLSLLFIPRWCVRYLSQQIVPPVSRLCEPIEGTSTAILAEKMGLDVSKFTSHVSSRANQAVLTLKATYIRRLATSSVGVAKCYARVYIPCCMTVVPRLASHRIASPTITCHPILRWVGFLGVALPSERCTYIHSSLATARVICLETDSPPNTPRSPICVAHHSSH